MCKARYGHKGPYPVICLDLSSERIGNDDFDLFAPFICFKESIKSSLSTIGEGKDRNICIYTGSLNAGLYGVSGLFRGKASLKRIHKYCYLHPFISFSIKVSVSVNPLLT